MWHTAPIPRLGVPSIRLSDGPNGVRGTRFFDSVPSACLPCGTAIGATFDTDLVSRLGQLLGGQAKAKGAHVLLGPTINIQRGPLGGRGFESFSEDPVLAGTMAGHYCKGVQSKNVAATLKHFVCNDMEDQRMAVNSIVTERALREIYLLPFQVAIQIGQPRAIMTAYNKVNGVHAAENTHILREILRDEWNWNGLVMSDWYGTYSTTEAVTAGLDLEMPGQTRFRGSALVHSVVANKVRKDQLDDRVRNVLNLVNSTAASGIPENAPETEYNSKEVRKALRDAAAQSIVLLKNEGSLLPFSKDKKTAVIGPNGAIATISGGGSASLNPYYTVTPLDGVRAQSTTPVDFAQGVYGHQALPQLGPLLRTPDGRSGFVWRVYNEPPSAASRKLLEERILTDANLFFIDYSHPKLQPVWYSDAEGVFMPQDDGMYDFGLSVQGTAKLYVDHRLVVTNVENQISGSSFLGAGTVEETGSVYLEAGKSYNILVQWGCAKTSKLRVPGVVDFGHGGLRFSACRQLKPEDGIRDAVDLAKSVDQVVLCIGLSGEWESEGQDRTTMKLPPHTDKLVSKVLEANPNTAIFIQSGTPVSMPWIDNASAVLQAWYGGNEAGNGIADIVFGDVNPSAKLPLTIPKRLQDNPTFFNFRSEGGRVLYGEDVYVGYRYYEKMDISPLFPFGHGLSYSSFDISDLTVRPTTHSSNDDLDISVVVTNTGRVSGAEVVQLYVAANSSSVGRPKKELQAFSRVFLEAGQQSTVKLHLDAVRSTSFFDEIVEQWCSEADTYSLLIGASSEIIALESTFDREETVYWSGL